MSKKEISDPNYTKVTHGQTMIGHRELAQGMPFEDKSVFSVLKGSKHRLRFISLKPSTVLCLTRQSKSRRLSSLETHRMHRLCL